VVTVGGDGVTRRMSCSMTVDAVRDRTKTVTRRHVDTWATLNPGDRLTLIEKGMGLAKGERQVVLDEVTIANVDVISLYGGMTEEECAREGFPEMEPDDFVNFWLDSHLVPLFATQNEAMAYEVRRIEWVYDEA